MTREIPDSFVRGLTTAGLGEPDLALARAQHHGYLEALRAAGVEVTVLPPDEAFPDSCFVEDTAVVKGSELVLTRPGHPSRCGEVAAVEAALAPYFPRRRHLQPPATLDGGDVLRLGDRFLVGLSTRTNQAGADQLPGLAVPVGEGLHLKSLTAALGSDLALATEERAGLLREQGSRVLIVPQEEAYAANVVWLGGQVLVAAGYPKTAALLRSEGFRVTPLEVSEFRKQDGGLSCLSILF